MPLSEEQQGEILDEMRDFFGGGPVLRGRGRGRGRRGGRGRQGGRGRGRVRVCHICSDPSHIAPQCPNRPQPQRRWQPVNPQPPPQPPTPPPLPPGILNFKPLGLSSDSSSSSSESDNFVYSAPQTQQEEPRNGGRKRESKRAREAKRRDKDFIGLDNALTFSPSIISATDQLHTFYVMKSEIDAMLNEQVDVDLIISDDELMVTVPIDPLEPIASELVQYPNPQLFYEAIEERDLHASGNELEKIEELVGPYFNQLAKQCITFKNEFCRIEFKHSNDRIKHHFDMIVGEIENKVRHVDSFSPNQTAQIVTRLVSATQRDIGNSAVQSTLYGRISEKCIRHKIVSLMKRSVDEIEARVTQSDERVNKTFEIASRKAQFFGKSCHIGVGCALGLGFFAFNAAILATTLSTQLKQVAKFDPKDSAIVDVLHNVIDVPKQYFFTKDMGGLEPTNDYLQVVRELYRDQSRVDKLRYPFERAYTGIVSAFDRVINKYHPVHIVSRAYTSFVEHFTLSPRERLQKAVTTKVEGMCLRVQELKSNKHEMFDMMDATVFDPTQSLINYFRMHVRHLTVNGTRSLSSIEFYLPTFHLSFSYTKFWSWLVGQLVMYRVGLILNFIRHYILKYFYWSGFLTRRKTQIHLDDYCWYDHGEHISDILEWMFEKRGQRDMWVYGHGCGRVVVFTVEDFCQIGRAHV